MIIAFSAFVTVSDPIVRREGPAREAWAIG
jgi:hypothetical protein